MKNHTSRAPSPRLVAHLLPALCVALSACGPTPPPEPLTPPAPTAPPKPGPRPALALPARAVANQRAVSLVGRVGDRAFYVVGSERWIIDGQGKVEREREPLGDKLDGLLPLPGGPTVAWNGSRVYTFGDLAGAPKLLAESEQNIVHVRPGPASVLLFTYSKSVALDPTTGVEKTGMFPDFPVRDAIFVDDKRGAAYTLLGGIGTTADGGRTWKPLKHKVTASVPTTLHMNGTDVYLREGWGTRGSKIDLSQSLLGDPQEMLSTPSPSTTPLEKWLVLHGNPILSAVRNGIDAGKGTGVVAWAGHVARVDLATGAFVETAKVDTHAGDCRGATSGKDGYLVCATSSRRSGSQLWRVKTDGKLEMEPVKGATFGGSSVAEVMGTPAGGLLVLQGCVDRSGGMCVRQPDGSFSHVESSMVAYPSTMGPLADGRVVSVGSRKGDAGPLLEVVVSTARERKVLDEVAFDKDVSLSVTRPEEGADGEIRFLVNERRQDKAEVYLYSHEPGKKGFEKTLVPDAVRASFADGVLVAQAKDDASLRVSHDHGMTFRDLDMPRRASTTFQVVNRLGVVSSSHARVGWDPLPEAPLAAKRTAAHRIKLAPYVTKPWTDLACKVSSTGKNGSILPRYESDVTALFALKPAPKGTVRTTVQLATSAVDTAVQLALEGKDLPAGSPPGARSAADRWTLRWLDGRETDARPRSVSGKAPYTDLHASIRGAWAKESKLFVALSIGGKNVLVRAKGAGFETAEVVSALMPSSGAAQSFSSDGGMIAYLAGDILVVWKSGEAPRPIAMVNQRYGVLLGAPTKEGVAVLAVTDGQSYHRVFPIPDKQEGPIEQQWISASWDGWTRGPSILSKEELSFCGAKPQGTLFRSTSNAPALSLRFGVDGGNPKTLRSQRYEVTSDGQAICLESVAAELWDKASISVKSGASIKQVGLDVLRVVSRGKKADITQAGKPFDGKVALHSMTCERVEPAGSSN